MKRYQDKEISLEKKHYREWRVLSDEQLEEIYKKIKPEYDPGKMISRQKLNLVESQTRLNEGVEILHGLDMNKRIIVQGPPGSGKSTYALEIINRQAGIREQSY